MAGRVEGKAAVVVGGGQTKGETIGNGRATALVLAREGARVLVVDSMSMLVRARPPSIGVAPSMTMGRVRTSVSTRLIFTRSRR